VLSIFKREKLERAKSEEVEKSFYKLEKVFD